MAMTTPTAYNLKRREQRYWITINRPEKRKPSMATSLPASAKGYRAAHDDKDVRVSS